MRHVLDWSGRMYRYYIRGAVTGILETLGKGLGVLGANVVDVTATTVLRITDFEGGAVRTTVLQCVEDAREVRQLRNDVAKLKAQLKVREDRLWRISPGGDDAKDALEDACTQLRAREKQLETELQKKQKDIEELKAQLGVLETFAGVSPVVLDRFIFEEEQPGVCLCLRKDDQGKHVLLRWREASDTITYALVGVPREAVRGFLQFIAQYQLRVAEKGKDTRP